jgi:ATP-binding cassette subfamily C protein
LKPGHQLASIVRKSGLEELKQARSASRGLYITVGVFSFFANLLMLTGPIFMLQVYDRVLGSGSVETLLALSILVVFLFAVMGIMDLVRGKIMARVGARFQAAMERRVFDAVIRRSALHKDEKAETGLSDLEAIQRFIASPALIALFDIPWAPVFLIGIFIFHPWLGWLALTGGAILVVITIANQLSTRGPNGAASFASHRASVLAGQMRSESEMVQSMGMLGAVFDRWHQARQSALSMQTDAAERNGSFRSVSKTFRLFMQSAMLGLAAYLVLQGEVSPGAMIASSILMGRALAPIEMIVAQWPLVQQSRRGWDRLAELLSIVPPAAKLTELPRPAAKLDVHQLTVVPPGEAQASLRMLSFSVKPGTAVGVIGQSGAGKSTLARALTGVWRPAGGKVRLDGAALDQYQPDKLGEYIGYLPQRVSLFEGTIAENIARFSRAGDDAKVVEAAQKAAAHDMILHLPDGYDTKVSASGGKLSGGQVQRIGLARALYSDPVILVLDEPNSNLDNVGSVALNAAIKAMKAAGNIVLIMAHRPAAIQECDMLLILENGQRVDFGPSAEVLKKHIRNHDEIRGSVAPGGVS